MKKETLATGGALGLSVLVASCCIGPTLFLLFGVSVGALSVFSVLEPYQPIFIGTGGAALAFAGYRIACDSCDVSVLDMRDDQVAERAKRLGIRAVPAVVIDGELAACCKDSGPTESALRAAGVGQAL